MTRILALVAATAILLGTIAPPADAARVRVRQGHDDAAEGVKIDIPDLQPIDFKGLTNADALTVAIRKTSLLPAAKAGGKPLANLLRGTHLKKVAEEGAYFKVETADKRQGYVIKYAVARGNIALKPDADGPLGTFTARAAAEARMFPSPKAPSVGKIAAGQKLAHLFTMGGFYKVKLPNGKVGYVEMAAGSTTAR